MGTCDVVIVGAGPAGLSAALVLGRCRRSVLVFDSGKPRNAVSGGLHGYLSRDGVHPMELRKLGRAELARYATVTVRDVTVLRATRRSAGFVVTASDTSTVFARTLLLATGRDDILPQRPGFQELYGRGVYHCPFCDGWEHRDEPLIAFGKGDDTGAVALELLTWSRDVTVVSDGPAELSPRHRALLSANHIAVVETPVARLSAGPSGRLRAVCFADGSERGCGALFFVAACPQKSDLPESLGCRFDPSGAVASNGRPMTDIPGLFVAGNVRCGLHLAIMAAAEGAEAAAAINDVLLELDLAKNEPPVGEAQPAA